MISLRDKYKTLIRDHAIRTGGYTLSSGRSSSYFIDLQALFNGRALRLLGKLLYEALADVVFDRVGGPATGAIPMTAAYLLEDSAYGTYEGHMAEGFAVRDSGMLGLTVTSQIRKDDRVAILDDVVTTGGHLLRTAEHLESLGAQVVKIVTVVDRSLGECAKRLAKYRYQSLYTVDELMPTKPLKV